jgi:hypothetical protein
MGPDAGWLFGVVRVAGARTVTAHHRIADTAPPTGTPVQVYWWGENRWIVATWTGLDWRDELGRIVQGPIIYWKEQ